MSASDENQKPQRFSPYAERLLGYPNSPRQVRIFWHVVGVLLNMGTVLASIWLGCMALVGVFEAFRIGMRESGTLTIGSIAVLCLYLKLKDKLPWTYR